VTENSNILAGDARQCCRARLYMPATGQIERESIRKKSTNAGSDSNHSSSHTPSTRHGTCGELGDIGGIAQVLPPRHGNQRYCGNRNQIIGTISSTAARQGGGGGPFQLRRFPLDVHERAGVQRPSQHAARRLCFFSPPMMHETQKSRANAAQGPTANQPPPRTIQD
jgi:hypothetical protein